MLPDGFEWRTYVDGPALYLGDRQLANIAKLPNGKFRVCFHPGAAVRIRYEFADSEREAVLHVEAWAAKWEARLRGK